MDFRFAPPASEIRFALPTRKSSGKTQTASSNVRVSIQTPPCSARLFKDTASSSLYISPEQLSDEMWYYFSSYEAQLDDIKEDREVASCMRNGSIRLGIFEDTQWFDVDGTFLGTAPPSEVARCACILEFGGAWMTEAKCGLRWRVSQVRLLRDLPPPPPPPPMFLDD
jgi:hypothetical protein